MLSRRGLFRALRAAATPDEAKAHGSRLAKLGNSCVEPKGITCRRCAEACEAGAIRFRLLGGGRAVAAVAADACTGCGDCLAVCPVNAIEFVSRDGAAWARSLAEFAVGG